jgi:hypothetical protein
VRANKQKSEQEHRDVAILLDENTILTEDGEWPYDKVLSGTKIFAHRSTIDDIWQRRKIGEVLKYDGRITKWRKSTPPNYKLTTWRNHPMEVTVSESRSFPDNPNEALECYAEWRDWAEQNGGNIVGTTSSTSWSIFKATLENDVWETPYKGVPGIDHPLGGRLLPCKKLATSFEGDFIQWDLYSAYTRRLANLQFGGVGSSWKEVSLKANFDSMVERGMLVYIEADIKLQSYASLGPIPIRRPRYHPRPIYNISFPSSGSLSGIWTYEECRDARSIGAEVFERRAIVHFATGRKYFHQNWYRIIQEGRSNLTGYSRGLVKQTGNALWGRYAMQLKPAKTVWRENGKRVWVQHPVRTLKRNQCMELADQLCGKIRSDLYGIARSAGDNLLQGNTDGAWVEYERGWLPPSNDWRIKNRAIRIDLLDDSSYRYWETRDGEAIYIVPGITSEFSERVFDRRWAKEYGQSAA